MPLGDPQFDDQDDLRQLGKPVNASTAERQPLAMLPIIPRGTLALDAAIGGMSPVTPPSVRAPVQSSAPAQAITPPSAPSVAPVQAGASPAPMPAVQLDQRPSASMTQYQYKPLTGWRKALGAISAGLGAYHSPEEGEQIYNELFVQPKRDAANRLTEAQGEWDTARANERQQGLDTLNRQELEARIVLQKAQAEKASREEAKPTEPKIVTTEGGKMWTAQPDGSLKPLTMPSEMMPAIGTPGQIGSVPAAPLVGQQATAIEKPTAEKTPSELNQYTSDYLAFHKLDNTPENRLAAHAAFTKENKTDPGVARIEALGETRGIPVTDSTNGVTSPMNWNDYNRLSKQSPGRYTSPQFDQEVQAAMTAARGAAPKNMGQQVQSYGTFVRHAGDLYSAIDSLKNTDLPLLNRPINWLRNNSGDPKVKSFLAKLDPVRKEFESFLLNNRALYEDDRAEATKILDENASPAQMLSVLPSLVHTGTIRLEETNEAYKRSTGKDFPDLVSPEAAKVFKQLKVAPPATTKEGGETDHPAQQHLGYEYTWDGKQYVRGKKF